VEEQVNRTHGLREALNRFVDSKMGEVCSNLSAAVFYYSASFAASAAFKKRFHIIVLLADRCAHSF
jgi:hypothetical protein